MSKKAFQPISNEITHRQLLPKDYSTSIRVTSRGVIFACYLAC